MSDINVRSSSQHIIVDAATSSVSTILTGPIGPEGPSGASTATQVSVTDAGGHFTGSDLETILQEIGSRLNTLENP